MVRKKIQNSEYCNLISKLIDFISPSVIILFNSSMSKFHGDVSITDKAKILNYLKTYLSAETAAASLIPSYRCF
jgi:hypothetical protein